MVFFRRCTVSVKVKSCSDWNSFWVRPIDRILEQEYVSALLQISCTGIQSVEHALGKKLETDVWNNFS